MTAKVLSSRPSRKSEDIIRDVELEHNKLRIRDLAHELNEAMLDEERRKIARRLRDHQVTKS